MRRVNIADPPFSYDATDPEGFRGGALPLGPQFEAQQTGMSVYELPPGQAVCPYHYEYGEEEWLLVLQGRPSVRGPDGTQQLEPFDVMFFPRGPAGAHQVRNDSGEPVRVAMWSTVVLPTATAYPDSDKVGIYTGDEAEDLLVPRANKVGYWEGETGSSE